MILCVVYCIERPQVWGWRGWWWRYTCAKGPTKTDTQRAGGQEESALIISQSFRWKPLLRSIQFSCCIRPFSEPYRRYLQFVPFLYTVPFSGCRFNVCVSEVTRTASPQLSDSSNSPAPSSPDLNSPSPVTFDPNTSPLPLVPNGSESPASEQEQNLWVSTVLCLCVCMFRIKFLTVTMSWN